MVDDTSDDAQLNDQLDALSNTGVDSSLFDADMALADMRTELTIAHRQRLRVEAERHRAEATLEQLALASLDKTITARLTGADALEGTLVEIGSDYLCVETPATRWWVVTALLVAIEGQIDPGETLHVTTNGTAGYRTTSTLVDVIEDLMAAEVNIVVTLISGHSLNGVPAAVGSALTLSTPTGYALVPVSKVAAISSNR